MRLPSSILLFVFITLGPLLSSTLRAQRQMEYLGRGVVALRTSSTQIYVGWRLLGNDPSDIAFNIYRSGNGAAAVKINSSPITTTTNYIDTPGNLTTTDYTYSVKPVINGTEVSDTWANPLSGPFTLPINAPIRQYLPIKLQPTPDDPANANYRVNLAWVGDLDGDGEYDFVVERTNIVTYSSRQWIQAYKRDGTLLWQMTQGPNSTGQDNVYPGSSAIAVGHNDNVTVYDLDGDNKAEVVVLTANGVVFAYGTAGQTTLTAPNNEVQYISVIDGQTGAEKGRAQVPIPAAWPNQNHVSGHFGVLYSDGMRPSFIFQYANRNADTSWNKTAATWDYRNGQLTQRWIWNPIGHTAEGHQIRLADVDNDGRDEYVDIGHIVKPDGSGQINGANLTEVVHGDRFHVTDIDPDRPGLETFLIQQNNPGGLTTMYHSADKSALIKKWYAGSVVDVGRGVAGPFVPNIYGLQMFSTSNGIIDRNGNDLYPTSPFPTETIWWDGDIYREFLHNDALAINKLSSSDPENVSRLQTLYNDPAAPGGNYQANGGRPAFWGDILGDWREEIVCTAWDFSELRVYVSKYSDAVKSFGGTNFRIYTLMHNPQYRIQATTKGYVQSSYVDYYLGYNMPPPPPPPMVDAKLVWKGGADTSTWDADATASWLNKGVASAFTNGDTVRFDISGDNSSAVTLAGNLQPGALTVYSPKDYIFGGTGTLAGSMKLTKAGAGSLILPNTHTFTGATTVWDGALVVNGNLQNSPVTVWGGTWGGSLAAGKTGGRLAGTGRFSQPVILKYRGAITPGSGMNSAGTLTFASGLTTEDGTTFALDLSDDSSGATKPNDRISIIGNLSLAGTTTLVINPLNSTLGAGTYTLVTYTGTLTGSLSNLAVIVPEGTPYTLSAGAGAIQLTVPTTRAAAPVTWRGAGANWDLASSQNWLRSGSPDVFVSGDNVTFDAIGSAAPTVTLATTMPISGLTVNSSSAYTFSGTGWISGPGGLTKSGTGTLTIGTSNTYTGPTIVNGGVLAVTSLADAGSASSIGASTAEASNFILNGGILRLTGSQTNTNRNLTLGTSGGTIDITSASSSIQLSGVIGGTGTLTKSGPGTLLVSSANTYSGGTVINGGKLYLAGSTANKNGLGTGTVTINSGTLAMADVQNNDVASWNLIVPTGATARLDADGRCGLYGSLTGGGALTYYSPYIRTDLNGNWSAFTGSIAIAGGDFRISNTSGYANAALDIGAGGTSAYVGYILSIGSGGAIVDIGELAGSATGTLGGGPTASRVLTWRVGNKNTDSTFAGIIKNATSTTALTKIGTGALMLTGANTYTGATTVSAGKLLLKGGSLSGSAVTVTSGAAFGGNGSVTGNVTCNAGSTLLASQSGPLAITGNLNISGAITVAAAPGATLSAGTYPILTYTGTLSGTPTFTWYGPGFVATFDSTTAGAVSMTLVADSIRPAASLTWTGATSASWDATTVNWIASGSTVAFQDNDTVTFNDASTVTAITLSGTLLPAAVMVGADKNYTFSGSGTISSAATLLKTGTGTLTIANANTFTGGTTVTGGTLALGTGGSLSGPITLSNNTTLRMAATGTSVFPGNALTIPAGAGATISSVSTSNAYSGSVTGPADAVLTLSGPVSFSAGGTAQLASFAGTVSIPAGSQLRFSNSGGANGNGGAGSTFVVDGLLNTRNSSGSGGVVLGALSGSGSLQGQTNTTAGSTTFIVGAKGLDTSFSGVIANGANGTAALTKQGAGMLTLSGSSSYTGATSVTAGSLYVTGTLGSTDISVTPGATIGGTGTLGGNLTLASGARLALGFLPSTTGGLTVTGATVLNGNITVVPALLGGSPAPGTYTLLTYSGSLGGSPNFTWLDTTSANSLATFDTTDTGQIKITLTLRPASPANLVATAGSSLVALAWNTVPAATSYTVLRSTTDGSSYANIASAVTTANYTDSTCINGTTYYYVVQAVNAAGASANSNQVFATPVAPLSAIESWRVFYFGTAAPIGQAANDADPDGDGLSNLLEYALGSDPTTATAHGYQAHVSSGVLQFTFNRIADASLSYTVQGTDDLITWADLWTSTGAENTAGPVTVSDTVEVSPVSRRFLRLRVSSPAPASP